MVRASAHAVFLSFPPLNSTFIWANLSHDIHTVRPLGFGVASDDDDLRGALKGEGVTSQVHFTNYQKINNKLHESKVNRLMPCWWYHTGW